MPRVATPLTAAKVRTAGPGRYVDGDGLRLLVCKAKRPDEPERAFWVLRYTPPGGGKMREAGLGRARGPNCVSLAVARERARRFREKLHAGLDPLAEREAEAARAKAEAARAKAEAVTFAHVADLYIGAHENSWRHPKHRQQWRNTLRDYALPTLGPLPVGDIGTGEVMSFLEPLWRSKPETASRLRGRVEAIIDYARARGWREAENPARWRGHLDHLLPARSKVAAIRHHAALPWREVGAFMERLRQSNGIAARCLEFAILTGARSGEARGARWSEIDFSNAIWTIPGERMKSSKQHRVPLSDAAIHVLRQMQAFGDEAGGFIFIGGRRGSALSDVSLGKAVTAAGGNGATTHGFRSTFRDWAAEATSHPNHVVEQALAHTIGNAVEAAYRRGDLLELRRKLMTDWSAFCGKPMATGEVVSLRAVAG